MRVINEKQIAPFIVLLRKRASVSVQEDEIQKVVRKILADVQKNGDRAVKGYTKKFDGLKVNRIGISKKEVDAGASRVGKKFITALKESARRIRRFHKRQKEQSWHFSDNGIRLGQIIRPLERVGVYVPGGRAAYPSTVLMNVIPAQVAGVREIALCVPTPDGRLNSYVAAAIKMLGVKEVYRIGGAQAVGAMAYGTESMKKVDKIVGPGNVYVAIAKKMVFGTVGIDMVAGPSEICIIADRSAEPSFVASDLLSQAEHDEMASSILVTDSKDIVEMVKRELARQLGSLSRKEIARKSLRKYGAIILTKSLYKAAEIVNMIAPEHLEIMTEKPSVLVDKIHNAGAIFLGRWTPEPLGDYSAGPNHTLPTGGTARFSSPLGVYDFIKRTSLLHSSRSGFEGLADTVQTLADLEGLEAHGNTIRVRKSYEHKQ